MAQLNYVMDWREHIVGMLGFDRFASFVLEWIDDRVTCYTIVGISK